MIENKTVLYKTPATLVRFLDSLVPEEINEIRSDNLDSTIGVSFGTNLITPRVIQRIKGQIFDIYFYYLSASHSYGSYYQDALSTTVRDGIGNIYINDTIVTNMQSVSGDTINVLPGRYWSLGTRNWSGLERAELGAALANGNMGGKLKTKLGSNFYCTYVKANDAFEETRFYRAFGPNGLESHARLIKDYPKNYDYDMFVVAIAKNRAALLTDANNFELKLEYTRHPVIYNPDTSRKERVLPKSGTCIYEILNEENWGYGISRDYIRTDEFINIGNDIAGQFDIVGQNLDEVITKIDEEQYDYKIYLQSGEVGYTTPSTVSAFAITQDNIIGEIQIEYPDVSVMPTQIIGRYYSMNKGETEIIIGTDTSNVKTIDITTATTLEDAKTILANVWDKLNNAITIEFKGDKSLHQLSVYDKIQLTTDVFSAEITILSMQVNFDYTIDIVAEASANNAVPTSTLRGKTPIIGIGRTFYRPPEDEIVQPPIDDDDYDPTPIVPEIEPPVEKDYRIISGLNHPYNRLTGADNTDWYLGGTIDGVNADPKYDANGLRTRFRIQGDSDRGLGATFDTDYSLIFRDQNGELPFAIEALLDIGIGTNENAYSDFVGYNLYENKWRYKYPGFFSLERSNVLFDDGSGFIPLTTFWPESSSYRWVYQGSKDPIGGQDNQLEYVYNVGDVHNRNRIGTHKYLNFLPYFNLSLMPSDGAFHFTSENSKKGDVYRIHFLAMYGDPDFIRRIEYIGTTTTYGDVRSVQSIDTTEAIQHTAFFGQTFTPNSQTPPSRSL